MTPHTAISVIQRFFLDIIGTVIPGAVLLLGAQELLFGPLTFRVSLDPGSPEFHWTLFLVMSYVLGHGVTSVGKRIDTLVMAAVGLGTTRVEEKVKKSGEFQLFVDTLHSLPIGDRLKSERGKDFHTYRNLAMSLAPEEDAKIYRFMFLSLLNGGVSTAVLLLGVSWIVAGVFFEPVTELNVPTAVVLLVVAGAVFQERWAEFHRIAYKLPFSVASAKLTSIRDAPQVFPSGEDGDRADRCYD